MLWIGFVDPNPGLTRSGSRTMYLFFPPEMREISKTRKFLNLKATSSYTSPWDVKSVWKSLQPSSKNS
jgi:hypothetical protein